MHCFLQDFIANPGAGIGNVTLRGLLVNYLRLSFQTYHVYRLF